MEFTLKTRIEAPAEAIYKTLSSEGHTKNGRRNRNLNK